uniref:Uncharacterized protein n=1 Tax=Takifugu rubripes TaxID=31033 RepID=A0A3B5JWT8_TAKRU
DWSQKQLESQSDRQSDIERVVNRWLLDYYFSLGLQFFQRDQREDFLDIVHRPYEVTSHTRIQIRLVQLLDQVNDGRSSGNNILVCLCWKSPCSSTKTASPIQMESDAIYPKKRM